MPWFPDCLVSCSSKCAGQDFEVMRVALHYISNSIDVLGNMKFNELRVKVNRIRWTRFAIVETGILQRNAKCYHASWLQIALIAMPGGG